MAEVAPQPKPATLDPEMGGSSFYWTFGKDEVFTIQTNIRGVWTPEQTLAHFESVTRQMRLIVEKGGHAKVEKASHPTPQAVEGNSDEVPMCAIHNKPMSKVQGRNGSFWSCHEKLPDGSYCPYKPKK